MIIRSRLERGNKEREKRDGQNRNLGESNTGGEKEGAV